MADRHETGEYQPDYFPHADSTPLVPSCTKCLRVSFVIADLELPHDDPGRRYIMTRDAEDHLKRIAEVSPDLEALACEVARIGLCPLEMLRRMTVEEVALRVPLGECVEFDRAYRPGIQANEV